MHVVVLFCFLLDCVHLQEMVKLSASTASDGLGGSDKCWPERKDGGRWAGLGKKIDSKTYRKMTVADQETQKECQHSEGTYILWKLQSTLSFLFTDLGPELQDGPEPYGEKNK